MPKREREREIFICSLSFFVFVRTLWFSKYRSYIFGAMKKKSVKKQTIK